MKKTIVGLGVIILVIGSLLFTLPFISIDRSYNLSVEVPKSQILLGESFIVPASAVTQFPISLNAGDSVHISGIVNLAQLNRSVDDVIDFSVNDGSQTYLSYNKISVFPSWGAHPLEFNVTKSQNYNFVYDNSFSSTSKNVTAQLTNYWRETEYIEVPPWHGPIIPFEFAYFGVPLILAGISLTIFGLTKKETLKIPPPPP